MLKFTDHTRLLLVLITVGILGVAISFYRQPRRTITDEEIARANPLETPLEATIRPSDPQLREEVTAVIRMQVAAFQTNDFAKAYSFAGQGIKSNFALAGFERMVTDGYSDIVKSKAVSFGTMLDTGPEAIVEVMLENSRGDVSRYQYLMQREEAEWKVAGVVKAQRRSGHPVAAPDK
jgi:hypothetical protein